MQPAGRECFAAAAPAVAAAVDAGVVAVVVTAFGKVAVAVAFLPGCFLTLRLLVSTRGGALLRPF